MLEGSRSAWASDVVIPLRKKERNTEVGRAYELYGFGILLDGALVTPAQTLDKVADVNHKWRAAPGIRLQSGDSFAESREQLRVNVLGNPAIVLHLTDIPRVLSLQPVEVMVFYLVEVQITQQNETE